MFTDDVVPTGIQLVPKNPQQRALVEQWISVEHSNYRPAEILVSELVFKKLKNQEADEKVVAENRTKLDSVLAVLDKHLSNRKFFCGEEITLAGKSIAFSEFSNILTSDLFYVPYTRLGLTVASDIYEKYPNFLAWYRRIQERDSFKKVFGEAH